MSTLAIAALSVLLWLSLPPQFAQAAPCSPGVYDKLHAPGSAQMLPVEIACDLTLDPQDMISRPLVYSGSAASGSVLDCQGATVSRTSHDNPTILIRSMQRSDGSWDVPSHVRIRNCTISGDLDIRGLGRNGEAENVRLSSLREGHTQRAQAAAPSDVALTNITFVADGDIPVYAAPGVTGMVIEASRFTGTTNSVAIYLDAESARNRIFGNSFDIHARWRELIAVDGSADNRIETNTFEDPLTGGIFLYRNCGEGGTIRHQTPQRNVIADNIFHYSGFWAARPAIWLGSRQGARFYCLFRSSVPLGSSLSAYDYAQHNVVTGNRFPGGTPQLIVNGDEQNTLSDNQ